MPLVINDTFPNYNDIKSFIFLGDLLNTNSVEIVPNYILKKANDSQIELIKNTIEPYYKISKYKLNRYQLKCIEIHRNNHQWIERKWVEAGNSTYWIIEFDTVLPENKLKLAISLAKKDLNPLIEFRVLPDQGCKQLFIEPVSVLTIANFFHDTEEEYMQNQLYKEITGEDIQEIQSIYQYCNNFESQYTDKFKFIDIALQDFNTLNQISKYSPFKAVSILSIIEFLLINTKKDLTSECVDNNSITKQFKIKLNFLNNQFDKKIIFSDYFGNITEADNEKILGLIYTYRSKIAHGHFTELRQEPQEIQKLVGDEPVYQFIYLFLKRILTHCLKDPALILKLKEATVKEVKGMSEK